MDQIIVRPPSLAHLASHRWLMMLLVACGLLQSACTAPIPEPLTDGQLAPSFQPDTLLPTLADLWAGRAHFVVDQVDSGLPMGESDTIRLDDGTLYAYVHASNQSAGVVDQCGDPVAFPGCVVRYVSTDGGESFAPEAEPQRCLIPCRQCPCESSIDHIDQQQYPQVVRTADGRWSMVYEYRANIFLRRSEDGESWSTAEEIPMTGIWATWLMSCRDEEQIGPHPHSEQEYDCLVGAPPGAMLAPDAYGQEELVVFVGLGQNPGAMGCFSGSPGGPTPLLRKCHNNPLFIGSGEYGPDVRSSEAEAINAHFDFRTVSSADTLVVGDRTYMFYEGVRGPGAGDAGDTQFGLGLARTTTDLVDGPWELFPGNPILVDLPGNVGLGHADVIVIDGKTVLYTSLDGITRSRLSLQWIEQ